MRGCGGAASPAGLADTFGREAQVLGGFADVEKAVGGRGDGLVGLFLGFEALHVSQLLPPLLFEQ